MACLVNGETAAATLATSFFFKKQITFDLGNAFGSCATKDTAMSKMGIPTQGQNLKAMNEPNF